MNRLTQAVNPLPTNPLETFNYDPVGNRTNSNQNGASVFNTANQLLEDANFTYQYDNNGNQTRKTAKVGGAVTQFEYDAENKLVRVVSPTNTANYKYDGLGRRVEKQIIAGTTTVTKYVYDNEDILLELNGANAIVARYTHGPGIDEPLVMEKNSQSFYYHADGLGSITELTNQAGAMVQRYTYSSFGKIESQLDANFVQPYTYTSREFDAETALMFYRTRYFDSSAGRFLQEDSIGFVGGDLNLYPYVRNRPTNFVDPSGRVIWVGAGAVVGAGINIVATYIANNGNVTAQQLLAAGVGGAISGAVGALATPLGGSVALALGQTARGALSVAVSSVFSGLGGYAGQVAANALDPCHETSPLKAALFAGIGGGFGKIFPTNTLNSINQANWFGPTTLSGLFNSMNSTWFWGSTIASAGYGAASNF